MRAKLRLEGSLSIRRLAVMSFTRCLSDSVMLLLIFSMLLNPERLNFGYSVHSLSRSWHREGKGAHKKEMDVELPVDFWLISAAAVPGGSRLKPRGQRADGRRAQPRRAVQRQVSQAGCQSSATGTSRCHVCSHPVPCNLSSPCPHPVIGSMSTLICVPRTDGEYG